MAKGILNVGGGVVSVDSSGNFTVDTGLIADGASVFNETGVDVDFRVESDDNANMLFVDGGNDRVGIGISTPKTHLTVEGTVTLKEQADAESDTAAYGQIWVNTATPNELYYTTDSGVDIQITNATGLAADTVQDTYGNILGHSTAGDALNTSNGGNVALGCNAAGAQTTGLNNVAIGCHAMAASADDADNNIAIGKLAMGVGDVSGASNIAIGTTAMDALTTGSFNLAIGLDAMGASVSGNNNIAIGCLAMSAAVTGNSNVALGREASKSLAGNIGCNISIGYRALYTSTGAGGNIAIGDEALGGADTTGVDNLAIGKCTMDALTTGICNVAIGHGALGASTTGCLNVAVGQGALGTGVTTGKFSVALGSNAAADVTSGLNLVAIGQAAYANGTTGCHNIAIGSSAVGTGITTGNFNTAIGYTSMAGLTCGIANAHVGYRAGRCITSGCYNVSMGQESLGSITTGCENTAIGINAGYDITTNCQITNIGHSARQNVTGVTCIAGTCVMATQFTATSDCRSKKNIKDLPYGLNFINLLRPVSYKWKPQTDKLDKNGNLIEKGEKNHIRQRTMFGLLGQQVKETMTKLGLSYNDFAGYSDQEYENKDNPDWKPSYTMEDKTIQLTYDDFIAPLIKSVQELSAEVDSLKAQLKTI